MYDKEKERVVHFIIILLDALLRSVLINFLNAESQSLLPEALQTHIYISLIHTHGWLSRGPHAHNTKTVDGHTLLDEFVVDIPLISYSFILRSYFRC